jgi:hypothetical protein
VNISIQQSAALETENHPFRLSSTLRRLSLAAFSLSLFFLVPTKALQAARGRYFFPETLRGHHDRLAKTN